MNSRCCQTTLIITVTSIVNISVLIEYVCFSRLGRDLVISVCLLSSLPSITYKIVNNLIIEQLRQSCPINHIFHTPKNNEFLQESVCLRSYSRGDQEVRPKRDLFCFPVHPLHSSKYMLRCCSSSVLKVGISRGLWIQEKRFRRQFSQSNIVLKVFFTSMCYVVYLEFIFCS